MKRRKRKRFLNIDEKRKFKKYVYFFSSIIFLSILSFVIIAYLSKNNLITDKVEMITLFSSVILWAIEMFPAALIGTRIENNRHYEVIIEYIDEENHNNLTILYEAFLKDIIDKEMNKHNLKLLYYPLLFDHDYPEFNFHTYEYLNKDTQFIVKFLKDEILYFIGDSKILDPDILTEQWIDLEFKFDSISDIIEFVYNLYNVY